PIFVLYHVKVDELCRYQFSAAPAGWARSPTPAVATIAAVAATILSLRSVCMIDSSIVRERGFALFTMGEFAGRFRALTHALHVLVDTHSDRLERRRSRESG